MKFIQIRNTRNGEPEILKMGKDFDLITALTLAKQTIKVLYDTDFTPKHLGYISDYYAGKYEFEGEKPVAYMVENSFTETVNISDCYQSRPLIEIDGYCEFDTFLEVASGCVFFVDYTDGDEYSSGWRFNGIINGMRESENLGSIFLPENKIKYPQLYEEALEVINRK